MKKACAIQLQRQIRSPLKTNVRDLVAVSVQGQIAHPVGKASPYRIGQDGIPRVLPGTGGIVLNHRVGDRCVGLVGDHIEPGVSLHNNTPEIVGPKNGPNVALLTYSCVGNFARVVTGPCEGERGVVIGKHGGIDHVIVDFPPATLRKLRIGERIQITSYGMGLNFLKFPSISIFNSSPRLISQWGLREEGHRLFVPVTHVIPAAIMGSGLGKNSVVKGDYDIQLFDAEIVKRFGLNALRFGDLVGIIDAENRFGRSYQQGQITIGVVVHGDSTVSGHGPGVTTLLVGPSKSLKLGRDTGANLAKILGIRKLSPVRRYPTLIQAEIIMKKHRRIGHSIFNSSKVFRYR